MWIFLSDSFVSVVADRNDPARLLVRGRRQGDVERFLAPVSAPGEFPVSETPRADYRFRASVPRDTVARAVAAQASAIEYPNFKNTVREGVRHEAYTACWSAMSQLQRQPDVTEPALSMDELRERYYALGRILELEGERTHLTRCATFDEFLKNGPRVAEGFATWRARYPHELERAEAYHPGLFALILEAWPDAKPRA